MGRKGLTQEEYEEKVKLVNPHIKIIGKYIGMKKNIKWLCIIHNIEDESRADTLLSKNRGCKLCYIDRNKNNPNIKKRGLLCRKPHEQFIKEMKVIHPNIKVLGQYEGNKQPIECECLIDGHKWTPTPHRLLGYYKSGCPVCGAINRIKTHTKSHETFIKELEIINKNILVLGEYKGARNSIPCKCKICNFEWSPLPDNLLSKNSGCPHCKNYKGEKEIEIILEKYNINNVNQYRFNDCKFYRQLPFDFYLPQYNCCIEFDGGQHYEIIEWFGGLEGFIDRKIKDTIKNIYCQQNNIKLIRIPYWDFDNIEQILIKELSL